LQPATPSSLSVVAITPLNDSWHVARAAPGSHPEPPRDDQLDWLPAIVPGTVAGALRAAGVAEPDDLDAHDWWYRTHFTASPAVDGEQVRLLFEGLATVAEVYLNGVLVLDSDSMFTAHAVDAREHLTTDNELTICFRALLPLLRVPRRPRARWRTRLVAHGTLRFYRTALLGRAPGFAPRPAVVGPWRSVTLRRCPGPALERLALQARLTERTGRLRVDATLTGIAPGAEVQLVATVLGTTPTTPVTLSEAVGGDPTGQVMTGELAVSDVQPWWPHPYGDPTRYQVRVSVRVDGDTIAIEDRWVGFRTVTNEGELDRDGLALRINDVAVFARGAVWTPLDMSAPHGDDDTLRRVLERVRDAGMNMLRVPGISVYESDAFYDLCDELGILVWQDFMFANMDYPDSDERFMETVQTEVRQLLDRVGWRPSLVVLCGGSEVAQQAAMQGRDPALETSPLYGELLPMSIRQAGTGAVYVLSAPWGGDVAFRPDRGVANYYGVGAYLRPLDDARRADVRFAAECLAFSNVPDSHPGEPVDARGFGPQHPDWKSGVPRDVGSGWDFEDVRDHYLRLLYGIDPIQLRSTDIDRYLTLSRLTTGEVMAEVFGEWRRARSRCAGGLVLWLTDLHPGAGWGVLDHGARPKLAFHLLRRALAPVAVWSSDEGLGGIVAHVANDRPEALSARLRVALYRDGELCVAEETIAIALGAHGNCEHNVEEVLGHFVDVSWSYRFGPPAQDVVVLSLERSHETETELLSQAFRFPIGRPSGVESARRLGVTVSTHCATDGEWSVRAGASRLVHGCRLLIPGFEPADDGFSLEPGHQRDVALLRVGHDREPSGGELTAANLAGPVAITSEPAA
jgi:beta-mannosidase